MRGKVIYPARLKRMFTFAAVVKSAHDVCIMTVASKLQKKCYLR